MSTYKDIHGSSIQNVEGDPANTIRGQFWYDSTASEFKYQDQVVDASGNAVGAWSTSNDLNTAKHQAAGHGTTTSALSYGGGVDPGGTLTAKTETWNGSSWAEVNDLNTSRRYLAGAGADSASGLAFSGFSPPSTRYNNRDNWNGFTWTEVNNLNTGRNSGTGIGTATSALMVGSDPITGKTESWNGTNWTELNDLNTNRGLLASSGADNTSGLVFGGDDPGSVVVTETWNGTNWTEVNDLNTAIQVHGGMGTATAALSFGGSPPTGKTELWNGTNWAEVNAMNTGRAYLSGGGTTTAGLAFGGSNPSKTALTEEWSGTGFVIKTLTTTND